MPSLWLFEVFVKETTLNYKSISFFQGVRKERALGSIHFIGMGFNPSIKESIQQRPVGSAHIITPLYIVMKNCKKWIIPTGFYSNVCIYFQRIKIRCYVICRAYGSLNFSLRKRHWITNQYHFFKEFAKKEP